MEDVYLGPHVSGTRRLTLTESWGFPADWTPDSKWVILLSNRNGHMGIFKQSLNEDTAEPLLTRPEDVASPRVTPDKVWIVYALSTKPNDESAPTPGHAGISDVFQTPSRPVRDH